MQGFRSRSQRSSSKGSFEEQIDAGFVEIVVDDEGFGICVEPIPGRRYRPRIVFEIEQ
jgi:hypothetical protein